MSAAPKKQPKPGAQQVTPIALPTWQQTMELALIFVQNSMEQLVRTRLDDKDWSVNDEDVALGIDLALAHIKRLRADPPKVRRYFDDEWFQVGAAIRMGARAFSRQDCYFFRQLEAVKHYFDVLVDVVNFAEEEACNAD